MSIAASSRVERLAAAMAPIQRMVDSPIFARRGAPGVADFMVGNPQEMPLTDFIDVLRRNAEPQDKNWFAYKLSEPEARIPVARSLTSLTGLDWDPEDVFMTNAGFGALTVTLRAITEPGDEVIYLSPPWFFYELLIAAADAIPVRLNLAPPVFDLDPEAIAAAITPRTRAVIVNSPHNPSGRVYPLDALSRLATILGEASRRNGRTVHLIADEPYRRILFDGIRYHSAAELYPGTIITYSYGKILLAPGQRLGYIAVPPTSPERPALRRAIELFQWATGYAFADALMQHSTADLENVSIDVPRMQARRDRLVGALRAMGYQTTNPEGTFYVLVRCPTEDDQAFADALAADNVLVLPGTIVELPGWARLSLTASDEMVEQALPAFERAMAAAR
ncbi:MAG TPA: aminotransferase class I/II-fold pyridoxal phosphate-dependent enzyme [Candidatus Limnocylindrales bacterium]|nr:aminotransferase class I/II-fold pyridoxal phosphate-dependent enzyme [Candidatus Limnocylindrales bacterium]